MHLLDVSVLVTLCDAAHEFHDALVLVPVA
jgi:hypothetical protein